MKTITKAYKFRLYPTTEQAILINKTIGCCRFVYNEALAAKIEAYETDKTDLSIYDCVKRLPWLKKQYPWLTEVDSTGLQSAIRDDLGAAYNNFFRSVKAGQGVGFPKFRKKRSNSQAYHSKSNLAVEGKKMKLPKLGWVKCMVSTPVLGKIGHATVSRSKSGKYFVSLTCTQVPIEPYAPTGGVLGIDLGLHSLIITSDGQKFSNPRYYVAAEKKLAKLQHQLSRKQKGSQRYEKARIKLAALSEHVANQRRDSHHKLTTQLIRDYDIICIETLRPKNMMKNRYLAKGIGDVAWGELVRQLQYKADWHERIIAPVDAFYSSSQLCGSCGYQNKLVKNLNVRKWVCPQCGAIHDRDINAANNIQREGLRSLSLVQRDTLEPAA